jgi:transposase
MASHPSREAIPPPIVPITPTRSRVAGIDLANGENWVCIDPDLDPQQPIRRFGTFTCDITAMIAWLRSHGITSAAMEATGPYWFQVYRELTAAGIEAVLVDPRQTRNPRNRKTDMLDCQHIWQMHAHGLLSAAFVPDHAVQALRTHLRFRQDRERRSCEALTAVHDALARMNIKLSLVLTDLGSETGQRIITAILGGERNATVLATLRDPHCKKPPEQFIKALEGTWRSEDIFLLKHAHADYRAQLSAIADADRAINDLLPSLYAKPSEDVAITRKRSTHKTRFAFEAQEAAAGLVGVDLAAIDGIAPHTVLNFLGEIGFSVAPWPSSKAFCAWMGLCPNPRRSGGKTSGHARTTANRAASILKAAAHGLTNKNSHMGRRFAAQAKRKGRTSAIKDAAHRYARIIYAMMATRMPYDAARMTPRLSPRQQQRRLEHLQQRAKELGMTLVPAQTPAA